MITEKMQQASEMHEQTGKHIMWCIQQVAKNMTDSEITSFATEEGSRRFMGTSERATTGINSRSGERLSKFDQAQERNDMIAMIASHMQFAIITAKAAAERS